SSDLMIRRYRARTVQPRPGFRRGKQTGGGTRACAQQHGWRLTRRASEVDDVAEDFICHLDAGGGILRGADLIRGHSRLDAGELRSGESAGMQAQYGDL